jgi:hypothetical protein
MGKEWIEKDKRLGVQTDDIPTQSTPKKTIKPPEKLPDYLLNSAHLAALQPHLYAVGMVIGVGQYLFYYAASSFAGALVILQDHVHLQAGADVLAVFSVHRMPGRSE